MINNLIRGLLYVIVFVLLQVLFLNNIHFLRIATPFLYLYVILRLPLGESRSGILLFSFFLGLLVDLFGNTAGMHAFATTFAGFCREPLIRIWNGKDLPAGAIPSSKVFGMGGYLRYALSVILIHHTMVFGIESLTLFDPFFLVIRILGSVLLTFILVCIFEGFNVVRQKSGE